VESVLHRVRVATRPEAFGLAVPFPSLEEALPMTHTYAVGEFLKKLNDGALRAPLISEGFAKPIEGNREAFLFSPGTSCEGWTKIPAEIVETVEFLGELPCRDHSHPLVRIHFKEPPPNDPFAAAFSSLLRATNSEQVRASGTGPAGPQSLMMQAAPWIGEWLARGIADATWYGNPSGGGGGNVGLNRLCYDAKRKCNRVYPYQYISEREQQRGCEQMEYYC
jgi:hypothetical protein